MTSRADQATQCISGQPGMYSISLSPKKKKKDKIICNLNYDIKMLSIDDNDFTTILTNCYVS
jgi:hypothetical protein